MSDGSTHELQRRLDVAELAMLHATIELCIKKNLFTIEEFRTSCKWFTEAFDSLNSLWAKTGHHDLNKPTEELQALYTQILKRLFNNG